jgi:predicted GH43/DUF377 family glycosyl hydrolase
MARLLGRDIVHRWTENPIIDLGDLPFKCLNIYNAGCVKIDGQYILLITIVMLDGIPSIFLATSEDGYYFRVDADPFISASTDEAFQVFEERGMLDARITPFDDCYYITYCAMGRHGIVLILGKTKDFTDFERIGIVSLPDTKAGALFPKKINNRFAMLERPNTGGNIWVSYSNDLLTWGDSEVVLCPRSGFWDNDRVGCAVPPFEIEAGWLVIYYGVKETSGGPLTKIGAAILDKENPEIVIHRSNIPILAPREIYERVGDRNNLVFSTGMIFEDEEEIKLYYGAADGCICLGTITLSEIIEACENSKEEF